METGRGVVGLIPSPLSGAGWDLVRRSTWGRRGRKVLSSSRSWCLRNRVPGPVSGASFTLFLPHTLTRSHLRFCSFPLWRPFPYAVPNSQGFGEMELQTERRCEDGGTSASALAGGSSPGQMPARSSLKGSRASRPPSCSPVWERITGSGTRESPVGMQRPGSTFALGGPGEPLAGDHGGLGPGEG